MHDEIQRFNLNGQIADYDVTKTRDRLVEFVESMMREQGYVPALDIEPQFTVDYVSDEGRFNFALSVYGVKISREKTWTVGGILSGKEIPRYTPKSKSQQSSSIAASV